MQLEITEQAASVTTRRPAPFCATAPAHAANMRLRHALRVLCAFVLLAAAARAAPPAGAAAATGAERLGSPAALQLDVCSKAQQLGTMLEVSPAVRARTRPLGT